ncbi:MAG: M28 family peptidase [Crocinitomicaceae bacterium]|nr:M28 family peptidase [Crocinitomicaceae bacterium]
MREAKILAILYSVLFAQISISQNADSTRILRHLENIIDTENYRNYQQVEVLNQVAAYIYTEFNEYADTTCYQAYLVNGAEYKNVIARFGPQEKPKLIVGAHYDVCGDQDGADDNASAVAAMLELARLLHEIKPQYCIELVAFTLEEPPFFATDKMGSYVHAKSLHDSETEVLGMICMDMIGYYNDEKKSQKYPIPFLKLFYGSKGDYITVVQKFHPGKFSRQAKRAFKKSKDLKVKSIKAPEKMRGIDFSDHLNYWNFGYSAIFITNTGFYRNTQYHREGDTLETLDISRITLVCDQLYKVVSEISTNN